MSQPNSCPNSTGPPKKFLKKGEGLKRFAAFKPPLPVSANKLERRQTYVKFKLDNLAKKSPDSHFLHPDILADESINLSTKVPKIAPPKIMHTPVRPTHNSNNQFRRPNTPPSPTSHSSPSPPTPSPPSSPSPPRQPLRVKKLASPNPPISLKATTSPQKHHNIDQQDEQKNQQEYQEVEEERHQEPSRAATRSSSKCHKLNPNIDLSTPSPGSCVLALSQQIQQIQSIVNHLEEKIKGCECEPKTEKPKRRSSRRRAASPEDTTVPEEQPILNGRKTKPLKQYPKPGSCVLALGQQIQQIQLTVNELKEGMMRCDCGAVLNDHKAEQPPKPVRRSSRKTTLK